MRAFDISAAVRRATAVAALLALCWAAGCGGPAADAGTDAAGNGSGWETVLEDLPAALLSAWGTGPDNIWAVGGDPDDGRGPLVLHYDGVAWERIETGATGNLWWVYGFDGGPIWFVGEAGLVLRYDPATGTFDPPETVPSTVPTLFGIWGPSPDDLYTVGGNVAGGAGSQVLWHRDALGVWAAETLPVEAETTALFKIWGENAGSIVAVGAGGLAVHGTGSGGVWDVEQTGIGETLLTVHSNGTDTIAVGGFAAGVIATRSTGSWSTEMPPAAPALNGVFLGADTYWVVGNLGAIWSRPAVVDVDSVFEPESTILTNQSLHGVWVEPTTGDVWTVGGALLSPSFDRGVVLHRGEPAAGSGTVNNL